MRRTLQILGLTALTLTLAAPLALARPGGGYGPGGDGAACAAPDGDGFGRRGHRGGPFAGLDLTEDQQQALQALRQEHQAQVAPLRERLKANRAAFIQAWRAAAPSAAQLKRLEKEHAALRADLGALRIDHQLAALQVLSPEQRAQAIDRMAQKMERRHQRMERRGDRKGWKGHRQGRGPGFGPGGPPAGDGGDLDE